MQPPPSSPTRPDPYALVFGDPLFESRAFPALLEEVAEAGAERAGPEAFVQVAAVGKLLRSLMPEGAPGGAIGAHGAFVYHAYHHWRGGRRVWELSGAALDGVLAGPASADARVSVPVPAGYVRLPRQRLWSRVAEDEAAEPVDGFFWVAGQPTEVPARLDVLLALGLREGRPGLSTLEAGCELAEGRLPDEVTAEPRPGGEAFANILPGGELQDYRGLVTPAEALLLAVGVLAGLEGDGSEDPAAGAAEGAARG